MRLLTRPRRLLQVTAEDHGTHYTPRMAAIRLLAEKIENGEAGTDPYMPSDFIVTAHANETVWVGICVNLCGVILLRLPQAGGGERLRAVLEADVRHELGLDGENPPLMVDEPLASRGVDGSYDFASYGIAAALAALSKPSPSEPVSLDALREAKAAYDRRYPHGVEPQLVIRTDTTTEGPVAS